MVRIVTILVVLLGTSVAQASWPAERVSFDTFTAEALTVESIVVVIANVSAPAVPPGGGKQVTLDTIEVLKAPAGYSVSGPMVVPCYWEREAVWPAAGSRAVVFLDGIPGSTSSWRINDLAAVDSTGRLRSARSDRVWNFELRQLKSFAELREAVVAEISRPGSGMVERFYDFPFKPNVLTNDDRLLPTARNWVRSDNPSARYLAVRVFQTHREPQDVAALRSLLNDPYWTDDSFNLSPWSAHEYVIRQEAAKELTARGEAFATPELAVQRRDAYSPVSWWTLAAVVGMPLLGFAAVRRFWRARLKRPRARFWGVLRTYMTFLCFYLAGLTVLAWVRSESTVDDVVYARGGMMVDVLSMRGNLLVETVKNWPGETRLVHDSIVPSPQPVWPESLEEHNFRLTFGIYSPWFRSLWGQMFRWEENWQFIASAKYHVESFTTRERPERHVASRGAIVWIAYPYLAALCLAFPVLRWLARGLVWSWRRWRTQRRLKKGLCAECGYDLRGHAAGAVCPECGKGGEVIRVGA
jgi:hypothetical protein